ncbi:MAG: hypothetical protein VCB77_10875 [Alphaproteobacteria bacterium]
MGSSLISAYESKSLGVDMLGRNMAVFKVGLELGHEAGRAAQKVMGLNIVHQAGQQSAVDLAFAMVVDAGVVHGTRAAITRNGNAV